MTDQELMNNLKAIRASRREFNKPSNPSKKATTTRQVAQATKPATLDQMIANMSPEQMQAMLAQLQGGKK